MYQQIHRVRSDEAKDEIGRIPTGSCDFAFPHRCDFVGVATATPSLSRLADRNKIATNAARSMLLRWVLGRYYGQQGKNRIEGREKSDLGIRSSSPMRELLELELLERRYF